MKIACICNLNQMQFSIARHLNDKGYDVTLFLMEEYTHFLPEQDTWELPIKIKIVSLPWKAETFWKTSVLEIKQTFKEYTYLIGSEWSPSFLARIGRSLNVFIPIGTDLIEYPFQYENTKTLIPWKWELKKRSELQKWGILNAQTTFVNLNGDMNLENAFTKLGFDLKKRYEFSLPAIHIPSYLKSNTQTAFLDLENSIINLKANVDLIIISPNRISYTTSSIHNKGTDIILNGFAQFVKNTSVKAKICFCEYGTDIAIFKQKIKELNLENHVYWLPLLPRKTMWPLLKHFDLGFGNLKQVAYLSSVSMELAAANVPVLQLGANVIKNNTIPVPPYLSVSNENDIAVALEKFANKEANLLAHFNQEQNWYLNKVVNPAISTLCLHIDKVKNNKVKYNFFNNFFTNIKHFIITNGSPILYKLYNNK